MRIASRTCLSLALFLVSFDALAGTNYVIDLALTGVTLETIHNAIGNAKGYLEGHQNDTVYIKLPAGKFDLSIGGPTYQYIDDGKTKKDRGAIDISDVRPGLQGRLVFLGAGRDPDTGTTLKIHRDADSLAGVHFSRVTFQGLHISRNEYTVTQGHLRQKGPGYIDLELQPGFPTLDSPSNGGIYDENYPNGGGRYMVQYTDSRTDPHRIIDEVNNPPIPWGKPVWDNSEPPVNLKPPKQFRPPDSSKWRIYLNDETKVPPYPVGALVAVKSKHGGDACFFYDGSDIILKQMTFTQKTRCNFRKVDNVTIQNYVMERSPSLPPGSNDGQTPALASPDGGIQIGSPAEVDNAPVETVNGVSIDRAVAHATGDDPIALFNVGANPIISDSTITDPFDRGILLWNTTDWLTNNTLTRARVVVCSYHDPIHLDDGCPPNPPPPAPRRP